MHSCLGCLGKIFSGIDPADGDDPDGRIQAHEHLNGRRTIHDRHHHVGEDNGNLLRPLGIERDGLDTISRGDHTVTESL